MDDNAYGVQFTDKSAVIYPALTSEEANLIYTRMAIWTNIADGMADVEGTLVAHGSPVDTPNYYFGYNGKILQKVDPETKKVTDDPGKKSTIINIANYYHPIGNGHWKWKTGKKCPNG